MPAANFTNFRKNLKSYCDDVSDKDEVLVVSRKGEKHLVVLSLDHYNRLEKAVRAAQKQESSPQASEEPKEPEAPQESLEPK